MAHILVARDCPIEITFLAKSLMLSEGQGGTVSYLEFPISANYLSMLQQEREGSTAPTKLLCLLAYCCSKCEVA